ncbi:hypothetical protein ELD05_00365 [Caldicellulosiruptor changbaiensis]|uniref:Uncharacterized protein n=1 Tax=Caldicellulosiruptor changbaiensis TaxID=1222016 RepID=A0A3T0D217_9FIRM|nr:hypothetical protein [Caldicellulosiruptor changbaiensis]AZT89257.1 hypothetical protein ELD05_00365 [Caldicellulosiruptor changbaiensis]
MDANSKITEIAESFEKLYDDVHKIVELLVKFNEVLELLSKTLEKVKLYAETSETLEKLNAIGISIIEVTKSMEKGAIEFKERELNEIEKIQKYFQEVVSRTEESFSQFFETSKNLINELNKNINNLMQETNNWFDENRIRMEEIFKIQQESYQKLMQTNNYMKRKMELLIQNMESEYKQLMELVDFIVIQKNNYSKINKKILINILRQNDKSYEIVLKPRSNPRHPKY